MSFSAQYWAYFVAVNVIVAAMYFLQRGDKRKRLGQVLVGLLTVFVISFLTVAITTNKLAKSNAGVATDQAEMQLRIVACVSSVTSTMSSKMKNMLMSAVETKSDDKSTHNGSKSETPKTAGTEPVAKGAAKSPDLSAEVQKKLAFDGALKALKNAVEKSPNNPLYKEKLIVLLGKDDQKANREQISKLIFELKSNEKDHAVKSADGQTTAGQTVKSADGQTTSGQAVKSAAGQTTAESVPFSEILYALYVDSVVPRRDVAPYAAKISEHLPVGWFQDNAMLQLYSSAGATEKLQQQKAQIDAKYISTFLKLGLIMIIMIGSGLIGAINVLIQLATLARKQVAPPDAVGLNIPLKSVYIVFVSWFSIMLVTSMGFHFLTDKFPQLTTQPVLVASTTALTYLLSNLPGPCLIYWVALKPQGLDFWSALKIRSRTSTSGPVKLFALGCLAWCSAIPLIFGSAFIAQKFLKTQGSDNPVIGQIVQAAGSSSVISTLIFYLTLGVMAPIFEEILFRGFFYAAMKPRIGTFPAMLASAALFALLHFDKGGVLMLFAIGFVLAYTFEKTRSLLPSMVAHGMWNSGSFTMALILFGA